MPQHPSANPISVEDFTAFLWMLTLGDPRAPMKRGRTEAETCEINGWTVGTRLVGTESSGGWSSTCTIEITAIGERGILAKCMNHGGYEGAWSLDSREWRLAPITNSKTKRAA
jgi:hypothetical protein